MEQPMSTGRPETAVVSAFRQFQRGQAAASIASSSSASSPVRRATVLLVETYRRCNRQYAYNQHANPKRALTKPSNGVRNDGHDNENHDLILYVNDALINQNSSGVCRRYVIQEMLGCGTFGQVRRRREKRGWWCGVSDDGDVRALNRPVYRLIVRTQQCLL